MIDEDDYNDDQNLMSLVLNDDNNDCDEDVHEG
jgi:hypothetical protein